MPLELIGVNRGPIVPIGYPSGMLVRAEPVYGLPESSLPIVRPYVRQVVVGAVNGSSIGLVFPIALQPGNHLLIYAGIANGANNITGGCAGVNLMLSTYFSGAASPTIRALMGRVIRGGSTAVTVGFGSSTFAGAFGVEVAGLIGRIDSVNAPGATFGAPTLTPTRPGLWFNLCYCANGGSIAPTISPTGPFYLRRVDNWFSLGYGFATPGSPVGFGWSANGCSAPRQIAHVLY